MRFDRRLAVASFAAILLATAATAAQARVLGVTSDQFADPSQGCNNLGCHAGGKAPAVVLSGPTLVAPGSTNIYTLSVHGSGHQQSAGLNVTADDGDFSLGGPDSTDTQILMNPVSLDNEVTHTAAKPAVNGVTTFSFNWIAPPAAFTTLTLDAWGNAVDGNGLNTGDAASPVSLTVTDVNTVLCATAPPVATCATPAKSVLVLKSKGPGKQGLTFNWLNGPTTNPTDFDDPTTAADYAVCLYADSILVGNLDALHGSAWATKPTGFLYKNPTAPMIQTMLLAAGKTAGKAKIIAKGKGAMGLPPVLPFPGATTVTVQVVNSKNTNCWSDTYSAAAISKNVGDQLKAKH